MKKKQIKKLFNDSFEQKTPDFLSKIKEECKNTRQIDPSLFEEESKQKFALGLMFKRFAYGALACALFIGGIFVGGFSKEPEKLKKEASLYLDVNPSIEIQLDGNNNVIECVAGNDDGIKILENIKLDGVEINTALYAIVGSMYTNGYLNSETNSILVSLESENTNNTILLDEISKQIDNVFKENENMDCSIIAQKVESDNELIEKANQHQVSIGKMKLVEKIVEKSKLYTEENIEELVKMSIHELNLIYKSLTSGGDDEVISGKPGKFIENQEALNCILEYLNISESDVEKYEIDILYHHNENEERQMIYLVTIVFKGETTKNKYIVDCLTGEIMPEKTVDEWKDKIDKNDHFDGPNEGNNHYGSNGH